MATEHAVQKADGSFWRVVYAGGTIKWIPLRRDSGAPGEASSGSPSPLLSPTPNMGIGPLNALAAVATAGTEIWQTWEFRQQRKFTESLHEQSQSIEWLTDMMHRWANVHRFGRELDLRSSEFLARQVNDLLETVANNKKMALPQSLLYELDLIRDSFRSMRLEPVTKVVANGVAVTQHKGTPV